MKFKSAVYTHDEIIKIFTKANEMAGIIDNQWLSAAIMLGVMSYENLCKAENANVGIGMFYEEERDNWKTFTEIYKERSEGL